ncbi:1286_t:CDS:2, partial [Racocetra fulgida]
MIPNKKQKNQELPKNLKRLQKLNDNYAFQSFEPIESFNENTETTSENEEYISDLASEVWNYFRLLEHIETGNHVGSTGNMWDHLSSVHGITKENSLKSKDQLKIDTIFKTTTSNLKRKQNQTHSLVEWIIDSAQPLYILESQKFKAFIATLDPYYELPTHLYDEGCQFYNTPNLVNLENLETVFDNEIEYEDVEEHSQQTPLTNLTDIVEPYNLDNELSTKSLKKKFCSLSQNNEVENYLQLNEIDLESDACT